MYYILIAIALWGSLGVFVRISGLPVSTIIFLSCALSVIMLTPIAFRPPLRAVLQHPRALLPLMIVAPISLANTFSFYFAYQNTSIANAVLTHYTAPIIVALLSPLVLREQLTFRIVLALLLASVGLWVMLDVSPTRVIGQLAAGDRETLGVLAGLFSGLAYGILVIVLRVLARHYHPLLMTFCQNGIIALILLPIAEHPLLVGAAVWSIAVMSTVHSIIAPALYFKGMSQVTANTAAILGYLEPVCAIALGAIFLDEAVTVRTIAGGALILLSGTLTIRGLHRHGHPIAGAAM